MLPGLYANMPADQYHADPCPEPSLSSSIAGIIWHRTPLHGWLAHPKLNPDYRHYESAMFDLGSAAHALILEGNNAKIQTIEADDWRTNKAKEERESARAAGLIPVLIKQGRQLLAMQEAAYAAIEYSEIAGIFQDGKPEQSIIAKDGATWLRGRLDWLNTDRSIILDYKTVSRSANPESFLRSSVFQFGYDIQAAMYTMLNRMTGGKEDCKFLWLVQETEPPYLCSICGASPSLVESGERKLANVIDKWAECILTRQWPSYSKRIAWLEAPAWELARIDEQEFNAEQEARNGN